MPDTFTCGVELREAEGLRRLPRVPAAGGPHSLSAG